MLIKTSLLSLSVALPLLLISATFQDQQGPDKAKGKTECSQSSKDEKSQCEQTEACDAKAKLTKKVDLERLRAQVLSLQNEVAAARQAAAVAKAKIGQARKHQSSVQVELHEALDLIANSVPVQNRSDHSPSCRRSTTRARSLLTYYQWMDSRGHAKRADTMMDRVAKTAGDDAKHLNSLAWSLMTEKQTSGKYDRAAYALAKRMQGKSRLNDRELDTIALAMFLNGKVEAAVKSQKKAIKRANRDEYRRRLMVYQAALKNQGQSPTRSVVKGTKVKAAAILAARD